MNKYFDINEQGFSIRCKVYYNKDFRNLSDVVIATHGFGGNKDNKAAEKFAERILSKYKSFGVVCFDWPCHGSDARNKLSAEECVQYLDMVVKYVKQEMKAERVYNYSASFGAYLTLRYLHEAEEDPFEKIGFRCAAVRMYDSMTADITEDDWNKLSRGKEIIRGYDRKIKVTAEYLEDLKSHDVCEYDYMDDADRILMVHGTRDELVPFPKAEEFSENNVIELVPVEGADHPFSNPKHMDLAIQRIIEFFAP